MSDTDLLVRRLAAIQCIVEQSKDIGKTKIQKIVYFLQEGSGVPLHYSFRMHHYGPFSDEIDSGISALQSAGYIDVNHDLQGYGYHISPASADQLPWDSELAKYREEMTQAITELGVLDTSDLELYATIHFVQQLLKKPTKDAVINNVSRLKPRFSPQTIGAAYNQLVGTGIMTAASGS